MKKRLTHFFKLTLVLFFLLASGSVWADTSSGDTLSPPVKTKTTKKKKKHKKSKSAKLKVAKTSAAGMDDITDQAEVSQQSDQPGKTKK